MTGHRDVLERRFAVQRLTGPALDHPADAVRLLLAVQAQDPGTADYSLAIRSREESHASVLAAHASGSYVRTHILRPTWHYVAVEDLRWLLALTSARVESGMAARHRGLGFDDTVVGASLEALREFLSGGQTLTRREIGPMMAARGLPGPGEQIGHLLLIAELRGLVCSGPPRGAEHTYTLVDEVLGPAPSEDPVERDEALARLVRRFFAGHGPAQITDLTRWAAVNQGDVRRGLDIAGDALERAQVDGLEVWFDPAIESHAIRRCSAFLLPVFDEAYLSYPNLNVPRSAGHPAGSGPARFNEAGGGVVIHEWREVGLWKRYRAKDGVRIHLDLDPDLTPSQLADVELAADRLVAYTGLPRHRTHPSVT